MIHTCSNFNASGNSQTLCFVCSSGYCYEDLRAEVNKVQGAALFTGTKRTYQCVWNTYIAFCKYYDLVPFPASTDTLTSFITLVGYLVKSHKTVNNYLSALHWLHHICHLDMSAFKDINIKLTQRGLERTKRHLPNRKSPITPEMLLSFRSLLNLRDSAHLALWTTLLVGFFTFFRKANLCPVSLNMFSTLHTLSHCDFLFTSWGAVITVTLTKMCTAIWRHCSGRSDSQYSKLSTLPSPRFA